jgi:hypothetical protein
MDVLVNGVVVLDDIQPTGYTDCRTFVVQPGDIITTVYYPGNYESEHSYDIFDSDGFLVWSETYPCGNAGPITATCTILDTPIWDDYIDAEICTNVTFQIYVHNPYMYPVFIQYILDVIPTCLEWNPDNPYFPPPDYYYYDPGPPKVEELGWDNGGIGWMLMPCEEIIIQFDCHVVGPACVENVNLAHTECFIDYPEPMGFYYEDIAIVHPEEPIPPNDTGVTAIIEPTGTHLLPGDYTVTVEVTNFA